MEENDVKNKETHCCKLVTQHVGSKRKLLVDWLKDTKEENNLGLFCGKKTLAIQEQEQQQQQRTRKQTDHLF